jgi:hypothetical protein
MQQGEDMASKSGPDIIEDGLVLCLDAASKRSYPGAGAVWYDISGNGNHFNLYNTPTFDSDNGGSISFNGTDEYARSVNTIDLSHDGSYMIEAICKVSNSQASFLWELSANWNTNSGGCGLALRNNGGGYSSGKCHLNHFSRNGARNFNMPTENMKWNMFNQLLSSNIDSTGTLVYINTELKDFTSEYSTSKASNDFASVGINDYIWLGARNGVTLPMLGSIASFKIYKNKKLSVNEIRRNYLSTKERFA